MRRFLLAFCFSLLSAGALAGELPAIAALDAFRAPMEDIVREAGKGRDADIAALGKSSAQAGEAWKLLLAEPLDLERYGVPAERQEETWRHVRMLAMLVNYIDEAVRRGDRALILRSADRLPQAYARLRAALENNR